MAGDRLTRLSRRAYVYIYLQNLSHLLHTQKAGKCKTVRGGVDGGMTVENVSKYRYEEPWRKYIQPWSSQHRRPGVPSGRPFWQVLGCSYKLDLPQRYEEYCLDEAAKK